MKIVSEEKNDTKLLVLRYRMIFVLDQSDVSTMSKKGGM